MTIKESDLICIGYILSNDGSCKELACHAEVATSKKRNSDKCPLHNTNCRSGNKHKITASLNWMEKNKITEGDLLPYLF